MKPKFALSHDFLSVHHEYFVGTFASILLCPLTFKCLATLLVETTRPDPPWGDKWDDDDDDDGDDGDDDDDDDGDDDDDDEIEFPKFSLLAWAAILDIRNLYIFNLPPTNVPAVFQGSCLISNLVFGSQKEDTVAVVQSWCGPFSIIATTAGHQIIETIHGALIISHFITGPSERHRLSCGNLGKWWAESNDGWTIV